MMGFFVRYLGMISIGMTIPAMANAAGMDTLIGMVITGFVAVANTISNIYYAEKVDFEDEG